MAKVFEYSAALPCRPHIATGSARSAIVLRANQPQGVGRCRSTRMSLSRARIYPAPRSTPSPTVHPAHRRAGRRGQEARELGPAQPRLPHEEEPQGPLRALQYRRAAAGDRRARAHMRINEDVLRYLTIRVDELEEGPSPVMLNRGGREERPTRRDRDRSRRPARRSRRPWDAQHGVRRRRAARRRWRPKWKARRESGRRPPAAAARRPFFRRRKSCPFSGPERAQDRLQGRAAAAALHLRARQDRAEPHHRGLDQEAARAVARDQARALSRPSALHWSSRRAPAMIECDPPRARREAWPDGPAW